MPATDEFVMYGARAAIAGGLVHISEQVRSIELAVVENPALAFDLSKTVVESACRTILSERKITYTSDDDLPKLFKQVTISLPMLPSVASAQTEIRKSLAQTLNGLHTALQGICELRNVCGFASHGSDAPRPAMESAQALLAAEAADAIVGFLHRLHRQESATSNRNGRLEFEDSRVFNDYVDDLHEDVRIFDLTYRASEVLFAVDREAYRDKLSDFTPSSAAPQPSGSPA